MRSGDDHHRRVLLRETGVKLRPVGVVHDVRLVDTQRDTIIFPSRVRVGIRVKTRVVVRLQAVDNRDGRREVATAIPIDIRIKDVLVRLLGHKLILQAVGVILDAPVRVSLGETLAARRRIDVGELDGHHHTQRGVQLLPLRDVALVKDVVGVVERSRLVELGVSLAQVAIQILIDELLRVVLRHEVALQALDGLRIGEHAQRVRQVHVIIGPQRPCRRDLVSGCSERSDIALVHRLLVGVQVDDGLQVLDIPRIIILRGEIAHIKGTILHVLALGDVHREHLRPGVVSPVPGEGINPLASVGEHIAGIRLGWVVRVDIDIAEIIATA